MQIRKAENKDHAAIWQILQHINAGEDAFAFSPAISCEEMMAYWCGPGKHTYVAVEGDEVLGTFYIRDNQPGLGAHVANAGYAVAAGARGKGLGKFMGRFSIEEAKRLGYRAMQFNLVVKSNEPAVKLWKDLGFEIIGEIPEAFKHAKLGFVNAYVMYRKL